MKRKNTYKVGDVVRKLMDNPNLSQKLDELDALDAWKDLIGKSLIKYVSHQKIYKGKLYIKINSAVMRNELSFKKTYLIEEINSKVGKEIISDIILK